MVRASERGSVRVRVYLHGPPLPVRDVSPAGGRTAPIRMPPGRGPGTESRGHPLRSRFGVEIFIRMVSLRYED